MKLKSLQARICITAGLCPFVSSASLVVYGVFTSRTNEQYVSDEVAVLIEHSTVREIQNLAESRANAIQAKLQNHLMLLAQWPARLLQAKLRRAR